MSQKQYDVLIIGSGVAGISLALRLADTLEVALISKGAITAGASLYAQGGIAAVIDKDDSVESHVKDTVSAGVNLCSEDIARFVAQESSTCIQWLIDNEINFSKFNDNEGIDGLHLTKEGGHSKRRVVHAADATGKAIISGLINKAKNHKNIDIFENHIAIDLISNRSSSNPTCFGAYILDKNASKVKVFVSKITTLATGGASKVYLYTSNPDGSSGDGIAMGWRCGCKVANMEFNQFHPTCLFHPDARTYLISEAIRGEGAKLKLPSGQPFMHKYDERAELAPRDIVARAIDHEMKVRGLDCVYLDATEIDVEVIDNHFPNIKKRCRKYGFDITKDPIPVVPAAHYTCGGLVTNKDGETTVKNLYAVGEVAYTGLHGANRLASNSLMECLVFSRAASNRIASTIDKISIPSGIADWDASKVIDSDEQVVVSHNWDEIRRFMWDYVGIVRTDKRLKRAKNRIDLLQKEIYEYYWNFKVSSDLIELRNIAIVAELIIRSAMSRKESRGLHFSLDYPEMLESVEPTILTPNFE